LLVKKKRKRKENHLTLSDRDGDEQLTEDEFADLPSEGANINQSLSIVMNQERREEFQHFIDKSKNGKADRAELLVIFITAMLSKISTRLRKHFKDNFSNAHAHTLIYNYNSNNL
jgi:hypothetical protein